MGTLFLVSTGAGGTRYISNEAIEAINKADLIVSYSKYAKDLKEHIGDKPLFTTGMTKEIERATHAIEAAKSGLTVALISNGDANVYAMGSLVVELLDEKGLWDEIEYIALPGITAVLALASEVGAPLSQDFCLISLSDRLTQSDLIQKRIRAALDVDFVMAIYNPKSSSRLEPYRQMLQQLQQLNDPQRPVVIARDMGRENQYVDITTVAKLIEDGVENEEVNMSTTILIGNSKTRLTSNGRVLTPRGYLAKYDIDGKLQENWRSED